MKRFLPYQRRWLRDRSPLKIIEKSRQIGISIITAYSAISRVALRGARLDAFVSSRDEMQAQLFIEDALAWAAVMGIGALSEGEILLDRESNASAHVLLCANGRRIYSLSSNPNALAGKRGHVILDEFALHQDQRLLYRVAKPVTTWGGQLEIISTHRGANSVFNHIIRDIVEHGNPMGWSHHKVALQDAVDQGLVEKINAKKFSKSAECFPLSPGERVGVRGETREEFLARTRAECLDEEQWLQEYCCEPADESTAFLSFEMIEACETSCLKISIICADPRTSSSSAWTPGAGTT